GWVWGGRPEVSEDLVEATPPVTVYGPEGDERREAARLLRDAGIGFEERSSNEGPLVADFGGLTFEGLDGVHDLIKTLESMHAAFVKAGAKYFPERFGRARSGSYVGRA